MTDGLIILVDQDGPLADFDARFYDLCHREGWPLHGGEVHAEALCTEHRFATDCLLDPDHRREARAVVDCQPWFDDLPVVPGAVEGLHALAEHPEVAEVWICTKPLEANPTCRDDKAAWLARHFGEEWLQRLLIMPDKSMARGHILLDDAPKSAWFDRAEWRPVVFPMAWNRPDGTFSTKAGLNALPRWAWTDPIDQLVSFAHAARPLHTR